MGLGHVMRCLTLADALRVRGAKIEFVMRAWPDHYGGVVEARGYPLYLLPALSAEHPSPSFRAADSPPHQSWLGVPWQEDARDICAILKQTAEKADLLIVDHYGIDHRWQEVLREYADKIMVIDDLADRSHDCDVLLDQTFDRDALAYEGLVPHRALVLTGADYMLLRPEFAALRERALARREEQSDVKTVLIAMGSADPDNISSLVLQALAQIEPALDVRVVLSSKAPHLEAVKALAAASSRHKVRLLVDCADMDAQMAEADIAFGAAGTSSWERCCLGLPTILVTIAENQKKIAKALDQVGALCFAGDREGLSQQILTKMFFDLAGNPDKRHAMSRAASAICDGQGTPRVISHLL